MNPAIAAALGLAAKGNQIRGYSAVCHNPRHSLAQSLQSSRNEGIHTTADVDFMFSLLWSVKFPAGHVIVLTFARSVISKVAFVPPSILPCKVVRLLF
jgi:hypothetical protein